MKYTKSDIPEDLRDSIDEDIYLEFMNSADVRKQSKEFDETHGARGILDCMQTKNAVNSLIGLVNTGSESSFQLLMQTLACSVVYIINKDDASPPYKVNPTAYIVKSKDIAFADFVAIHAFTEKSFTYNLPVLKENPSIVVKKVSVTDLLTSEVGSRQIGLHLNPNEGPFDIILPPYVVNEVRKRANCHAQGDGVPQDFSEAFKWWRMAAEQRNAVAQLNRGTCYAQGDGVPQDFSEALKWWRMAAEQGDIKAQFSLGLNCFQQETDQGLAEAMEWWHKAAEQGMDRAQYLLGELYMKDKRVHQNSAEAAKWYHKAADQGFAKAQTTLGICYLQGEGVPKDYKLAYMWFNIAKTSGEPRANQGLEIASRQMTSEQIAEAKLLSRDWKLNTLSNIKHHPKPRS